MSRRRGDKVRRSPGGGKGSSGPTEIKKGQDGYEVTDVEENHTQGSYEKGRGYRPDPSRNPT